MSFKKGLAAAFAAGTIATVGITTLQPKPADTHTYEEQGGHAKEIQDHQLREEGNGAADTEHQRRLIPGEVRPPEPKLPFRVLP